VGGTASPQSADNQQRLDELKEQAQRLLADGFGRVQSDGKPDRNMVLALLSLAQVYIETQQPQPAIDVLEHARVGPLTLVKQNHTVVADKSVVEETYKTALRAYIGALSTTSDRAAMLAKAQDTMTKLKAAVVSGEGGQDRALAVFVGLARVLERQLKVAAPAAKAAVAQGFESFLKQIRAETSDVNLLNWVAESFLSLGTGFEEGGTAAEAQRYYQESRTTFEKILAETKPDPQMLTQVQIRLAAVARKQRDYQAAIDTYVKVLTGNVLLINVQVEAAKAYQEWAAAPQQEAHYERAISGYHPGRDGKNLVWGWGRIGQITARYTQYRDTFHEANVNLAWCRVLNAERQQGAEKDKWLKAAFNGVVVVRRLYPDLGGDTWLKQYEAVTRRIQQGMGQPAIGLQAIPAPTSTPPNGAATNTAALK
jgi:tetratricopeptide (TPR) repeat protein